MKNAFFSKSILFVCFALLGLNAQSKTIYLSASGNNEQSGLDESHAVATLSQAVSLCSSGDEISVSGIIDLSKESYKADGLHLPDLNLKINGKDAATSGFSGSKKAIWFSGNTLITNCTFSNNKSTTGILCFADVDLTLTNCIFKSNEGTPLHITNKETEVLIKNTIQIEACLFASNVAGEDGGGALFLDNLQEGKTVQLAIANSTFYNNQAERNGGAMLFSSLQEGSSVDLINNTIVGNRIENIIAGGAGLYFNSDAQPAVKRIYNCIIESNIPAGTAGKASDIAFRDQPEEGKDLIVSHSYIGSLWVKIFAFDLTDTTNRTNYQLGEQSELAMPYAGYIASQNSIPLEYNASGIYFGNANYLKDLNISTDQNGNMRAFANNKCAVGAVEKPALPPAGVESHTYQHFIIYGQSLSTGHEAYPVSVENVPGNYMIGNQIWMNYGNRNFEQLNPLAANYSVSLHDISECPLHGAVNHIRLKQQEVSPGIDNRFIATSAGTSGQTIEDLSKESQVRNFYSDFQNAIKNAKRIITKTNSPISCPAIFWLQGEWNYQGYESGLTPGSKPTADKNAYKSLLVKLKSNMQQEIQERYLQEDKPLFITYQVGAQYTKGRTIAIGMAQLEASNEYQDIVCAGPVYPMTDVGGHLDGNGYRWYGEMLGKVYYKTRILGEDFRPLQPKRLARDPENPKKVYITFHVPEPPLVLDINTLKQETNYGFKLYLRGSETSIDKVEIVNDSVVAITGRSDLTANRLDVAYGSESTRGHGNLRDSDPYQAFYHYENPDKKDDKGNFVFDHNGKASLIPSSGEPKDTNGQVIYDQPYPLYNFCVAFYYEISKDSTEYIVPNWNGLELKNSINKVKIPEISIYQTDKTLTISATENLQSVELLNIQGRRIKVVRNINSTFCKMDLNVPNGIYLVKAGAIMRKVIVK